MKLILSTKTWADMQCINLNHMHDGTACTLLNYKLCIFYHSPKESNLGDLMFRKGTEAVEIIVLLHKASFLR